MSEVKLQLLCGRCLGSYFIEAVPLVTVCANPQCGEPLPPDLDFNYQKALAEKRKAKP